MALGNLEEAGQLLSDEGMKTIHALHQELQRVTWHLRDAEEVAGQRLVSAEEQTAKANGHASRQQEVAHTLRRVEQEHEEELQHTALLRKHLEMAQQELSHARARQARLVPGEAFDALREEIRRLKAQTAEAEEEGGRLRARITEVEETTRRRAQRQVCNLRDSDAKRLSPGHARASRMSEAKLSSSRAMQEQKEKDTKIQAERISRLCENKERLEQEYSVLFKQNVSLEQRMDTLRSRNRQLEAQQRKQRAAAEEQEAKLQAQKRKQEHQLKVLTDLLRLPPDATGNSDREYCLAESGGASTAASAGSISASTLRSTSAHARSAGAISEPGLGVVKSSDGSMSPSLSQVATTVIGDQLQSASSTCAENVVAGVVDDSFDDEISAAPELPGTQPAIPSHLETAISRTQDLINEVQGWCQLAGEEEPSERPGDHADVLT